MICPNCGKEVRGRFCSSCGGRVDQEQPRSPLAEEGSAAQRGATATMPIPSMARPAASPFASAAAAPSVSVVRDNPNRTVVIRPEDVRSSVSEAAPQPAPSRVTDMSMRLWIVIPAIGSIVFGAFHLFEHWVRHDAEWPLGAGIGPFTFILLESPGRLPRRGARVCLRRLPRAPGGQRLPRAHHYAGVVEVTSSR